MLSCRMAGGRPSMSTRWIWRIVDFELPVVLTNLIVAFPTGEDFCGRIVVLALVRYCSVPGNLLNAGDLEESDGEELLAALEWSGFLFQASD